MIYDLHSHTTASDGILTPPQLVQRAVQMRVSVLAITDHDSTLGLAEAQAEITRSALPLQLIQGVEISTLWQKWEIHLVGLKVASDDPALCALLAEQMQRRQLRVEMIAHRLAKAHIADTLADAKAFATGGVITRAHFARVLQARGYASTAGAVFKKYLSQGKIGYVPAQWCTIEQAVAVIQQAGGQAVLAHPARYGLSAKWLKRLINWFAAAGGDAIEVAQCQQANDERRRLADYAIQHNLLASQGSDFHLPCSWIELGRNLWLPAGVDAVWQHWNLPVDGNERQ